MDRLRLLPRPPVGEGASADREAVTFFFSFHTPRSCMGDCVMTPFSKSSSTSTNPFCRLRVRLSLAFCLRMTRYDLGTKLLFALASTSSSSSISRRVVDWATKPEFRLDSGAISALAIMGHKPKQHTSKSSRTMASQLQFQQIYGGISLVISRKEYCRQFHWYVQQSLDSCVFREIVDKSMSRILACSHRKRDQLA